MAGSAGDATDIASHLLPVVLTEITLGTNTKTPVWSASLWLSQGSWIFPFPVTGTRCAWNSNQMVQRRLKLRENVLSDSELYVVLMPLDKTCSLVPYTAAGFISHMHQHPANKTPRNDLQCWQQHSNTLLHTQGCLGGALVRPPSQLSLTLSCHLQAFSTASLHIGCGIPQLAKTIFLH